MLFTGLHKPEDDLWSAYIHVSGQGRYLGHFDDEEAAARAYNDKAKKIIVNFLLNFLTDGSLNPDRKQRRTTPSAIRSSGATAMIPPPRAMGARHPTASASASSSSLSGASAHVKGSNSGSDGDDEDDAITIAVKEEEMIGEEGGGGSSSRRICLRRRRVVKEEDKDASRRKRTRTESKRRMSVSGGGRGGSGVGGSSKSRSGRWRQWRSRRRRCFGYITISIGTDWCWDCELALSDQRSQHSHSISRSLFWAFIGCASECVRRVGMTCLPEIQTSKKRGKLTLYSGACDHKVKAALNIKSNRQKCTQYIICWLVFYNLGSGRLLPSLRPTPRRQQRSSPDRPVDRSSSLIMYRVD